jgi:hypothetical protein
MLKRSLNRGAVPVDLGAPCLRRRPGRGLGDWEGGGGGGGRGTTARFFPWYSAGLIARNEAGS